MNPRFPVRARAIAAALGAAALSSVFSPAAAHAQLTLAPASIASMTPNVGDHDWLVFVQGTSLGLVTKVAFEHPAGTWPATIVARTGTAMAVRVPRAPAGAGTLVFHTSGGTLRQEFSIARQPSGYYESPPANGTGVEVSEVRPRSGKAGALAFIHGSWLESADSVRLDTWRAPVRAKAYNGVVFEVPQAPAGDRGLTVYILGWSGSLSAFRVVQDPIR